MSESIDTESNGCKTGNKFLSAALVLVMSLSTGCGGNNGTSNKISVEQAKSSLTRNMSPQAPQADIDALVDGDTTAALELFKAVRDDKNLTISPYSVTLALAMTWAGAKGETDIAMANALHLSLGRDRLFTAFNWLDLELKSLGKGAQGVDGKPFKLSLADALWGQKGFDFAPAYLDALATQFGAGIYLLDFAKDSENARVTINDWVSDQTEDRVNNLLQPGDVGKSTVLVLTNTVYFNAAWRNKFLHSATSDAPFTLMDANTVNVPTMHGEVNCGYAENGDLIALQLPYDGDEVAMTVVMPKAGSLNDFVSTLDSAKLKNITAALSSRFMGVDLPKFKFEWKKDLKGPLTQMGMGIAFSDQADFTGIHAAGGIEIGDVIHQTFVAVDEDGTEAAAATAVVIVGTAMPTERVTIDHPFAFSISDLKTGTVLFIGQVVDPR